MTARVTASGVLSLVLRDACFASSPGRGHASETGYARTIASSSLPLFPAMTISIICEGGTSPILTREKSAVRPVPPRSVARLQREMKTRHEARLIGESVDEIFVGLGLPPSHGRFFCEKAISSFIRRILFSQVCQLPWLHCRTLHSNSHSTSSGGTSVMKGPLNTFLNHLNTRLSTNLPALQQGSVPVMFAPLDAMTCG